MKPTVRIALFAVVSGVLALLPAVSGDPVPTVSAPTQPEAPAMVMLADLRGEGVEVYGYGSWKDRLNTTANGLMVLGPKGAQGDGGVCGNLTPNFDLSGANWIEIALGLGQSNGAATVVVGLSDPDGTLVTARIRVDQIVPQQPVWFRVPASAFAPVGGAQSGTNPEMDWTKVAQWHVQGDWGVKVPHQLVVIALRARR